MLVLKDISTVFLPGSNVSSSRNIIGNNSKNLIESNLNEYV